MKTTTAITHLDVDVRIYIKGVRKSSLKEVSSSFSYTNTIIVYDNIYVVAYKYELIL